MQEDFHYYATYSAAYLAGYTHEESMDICYSAQFVDLCSKTLLSKIGAPLNAATTQLQLEMADSATDLYSLQEITRIWASFHFLPYDLNAVKAKRPKSYMRKYRMICAPNGDLLQKTVRLAAGGSLQRVGIAMHILADTWAHTYFAGTPSLVINNTTNDFREIITDGDTVTEKKIKFRHSVGTPDDLDNCIYTNTVYQGKENSVMNLGHGRAGHLPDYSFAKYRYLPAWNDYLEIVKDNPHDYMKAFTQMIYAMKCLKNGTEFMVNTYDTDAVAPFDDRIKSILCKRQIVANEDWKCFGEELSGRTIDDFDTERYLSEYTDADDKDDTFMGRFITGALAQKSMVTDELLRSGNNLAGLIRKKTANADNEEDK